MKTLTIHEKILRTEEKISRVENLMTNKNGKSYFVNARAYNYDPLKFLLTECEIRAKR